MSNPKSRRKISNSSMALVERIVAAVANHALMTEIACPSPKLAKPNMPSINVNCPELRTSGYFRSFRTGLTLNPKL